MIQRMSWDVGKITTQVLRDHTLAKVGVCGKGKERGASNQAGIMWHIWGGEGSEIDLQECMIRRDMQDTCFDSGKSRESLEGTLHERLQVSCRE